MRLPREHIQRRAADPFLFEGGAERLFVDDEATRNVHDMALRPERVQDGVVDGVARLGAGPDGDHEHIGPGRETEQAVMELVG